MSVEKCQKIWFVPIANNLSIKNYTLDSLSYNWSYTLDTSATGLASATVPVTTVPPTTGGADDDGEDDIKGSELVVGVKRWKKNKKVVKNHADTAAP